MRKRIESAAALSQSKAKSEWDGEKKLLYAQKYWKIMKHAREWIFDAGYAGR
jgi:hypothetical protein